MFKNKCIFVTIVMILFLVFCSSIFAQVSVKGYYRKDGTYVKPYVRTSPDRNPYNNYSFPGNYNPNTDKISTGNTETYLKNYYDKPKSTAQVRVKGYYKKDGTYVRSHTRTKPDGNPYNNYSYPGNYNPNTGKITTGNPETYLKNWGYK